MDISVNVRAKSASEEEREGERKALWARGIEALNTDRYDDALYFFAELVKRGHEQEGLWAKMGSCYAGLGRFREALAAFTEELKTDAGNAEALSGSANALYRLGRAEEAAKLCDMYAMLYDDGRCDGLKAKLTADAPKAGAAASAASAASGACGAAQAHSGQKRPSQERHAQNREFFLTRLDKFGRARGYVGGVAPMAFLEGLAQETCSKVADGVVRYLRSQGKDDAWERLSQTMEATAFVGMASVWHWMHNELFVRTEGAYAAVTSEYGIEYAAQYAVELCGIGCESTEGLALIDYVRTLASDLTKAAVAMQEREGADAACGLDAMLEAMFVHGLHLGVKALGL